MQLEKFERLTKCAIELGEHDIEYHPLTSIKGQALVDFLMEIPNGPHSVDHTHLDRIREPIARNYVWVLYTYRVASKEGSREGLTLRDSEGNKITYALCFDFETSNNEVVNEALLT